MKYSAAGIAALFFAGCAALFGWDIHAPGILSANFFQQVRPIEKRIGLYLPPETRSFLSHERGGRTADPQTYHVGEALAPIAVEAFSESFTEFVFLEIEPDPALLKRYGIPCAAVIRVRGFQNRVAWTGYKGLALQLETVVLDQDLNPLTHFETEGASEAKKIFAKKGGPEVQLNAAIENAVTALVQHLQDLYRTGKLP